METHRHRKMEGKLYQFQTALASSFGQTTMGLLNTWPSYTANTFLNETTPLSEPMTVAEISLLGSLPSLGAVLGSAIAGILMDKLGRRNGGVVIALPFMISWAIISMTTSKMVVLIARFLGGMAGGGFLVYGPVFISEVAEDSVRGTLASGPTLLFCFGMFLSYIFGWILSYRTIIWVNSVFSVAVILLILPVKESPVFLLRQKRDKEARDAIAHYRGVCPSSKLVLDEMTKLRQQLMLPMEVISADAEKTALKEEEAEKEKLAAGNIESEKQKQMLPIKLLFVSPSSRRAFLVVMSVMTTQVGMGIVPVFVFANKIFTKADPANANLYTIMFAFVCMCGCMVSTAIADLAGRRILIMTSSTLMGLCAGSLGYVIQSGTAPLWVTMVVIMLYSFSFMTGAGSVPYLLLAEVFISEVQNLASMIIIEWVWLLNFAIIAIFPYMNTFLGIHGTFYCFAVVAISNVVICYFIVPETKGLSKEQIQELLLGKKKK